MAADKGEGSKTLWMGATGLLKYLFGLTVRPHLVWYCIFVSGFTLIGVWFTIGGSVRLEPYMDDCFVLQAFEQMGEPAVQVKVINNKFSGTGEDDNFVKIYGQEREISAQVGRKYPELRLPAGYCFVDFADAMSAHRAMLRLNGKIIPNSQPPCRFKLNYNMKDNPDKEFSLFVGELSEEVDDYILFRAFVKKYPSCHTAKVVYDSQGNSKGYGFVRFAEETDQQRALIEMQHTIGIGRKPIRVSLATPKRNFLSEHVTTPSMPQYSGSYNKAYEDYYAAYYQQYYASYYANQTQPQQLYNPEDDQNVLEEPELDIDIEKYNRDYMAQSEEIFDALEDSRWHPMDQWNTNVPATAR